MQGRVVRWMIEARMKARILINFPALLIESFFSYSESLKSTRDKYHTRELTRKHDRRDECGFVRAAVD